METEERQNALCSGWRTAASVLLIRIEAPYVLKNANGTEVRCIAHLPDFGSSKGMVIGHTTRPGYEVDGALKSAAESRGLFYTFINADV